MKNFTQYLVEAKNRNKEYAKVITQLDKALMGQQSDIDAAVSEFIKPNGTSAGTDKTICSCGSTDVTNDEIYILNEIVKNIK